MQWKRLLTGFARRRSGLVLLGGVTAVLTGVERLIAPRPLSRTQLRVAPSVTLRIPREHYFTIRQTRSDLGYVYWVLQGFGCYQSFALFDTWREAAGEAERRLVERPVAPRRTSELVPV